LQRAFRHGVRQVELADLHEPALLVPTIAAALGLSERNQRWTAGTLQDYLRDRQLLLLLDNCEHLVEACAVLVDSFLSCCPDLRVLATSREPFGIRGEQTYPVRPLSIPDPDEAFDGSPARSESVTLFVERARAVLPDFTPTVTNWPAMARLCIQLDGVPLAIELAALRMRALSPDQILREFARQSVTNTRVRDAPLRQRSLRAVVDWSYQLCSDRERLLWSYLSVYVGGFELDAAETMFAETDFAEADVADLIVSLVDKSIVMREECAGRVRLRMPEIIRSYGLDRLRESHQETAIRRRHRDWYVALSARAYQEWIGPDQLGWFGLIRMEHANIRAVLDFSLTDPDGAGDAVDIVVSLLDYWMAFGFLSEGRRWLDLAVNRLPANGLRRARALRAACILAAMQGDHAAASAAWEASRVLAEQADDERELGWVAWAGAVAALQREDAAAASYAIEESRRLFGSVGDVHGLIYAMGTRVVVAALSAKPGSALDRAGEFLAVAEPRGDRWTMSWALWGLGIAHWRLGDIDKAADVEARSLTLRVLFEDQLGLGVTAEILSWTACGQGHAEQAATLMGAARHCLSATSSSLAVFPYLLDDHQRCEVSLRSKLGDLAFELAIERGARLPLDEVVAMATGQETERKPERRSKYYSPRSPLTSREQEIAELVAQGMSNKQIAARLVIAQRTAEGHVEHILAKLGFTSRSQIAGWVAEHRTATTAT